MPKRNPVSWVRAGVDRNNKMKYQKSKFMATSHRPKVGRLRTLLSKVLILWL